MLEGTDVYLLLDCRPDKNIFGMHLVSEGIPDGVSIIRGLKLEEGLKCLDEYAKHAQSN